MGSSSLSIEDEGYKLVFGFLFLVHTWKYFYIIYISYQVVTEAPTSHKFLVICLNCLRKYQRRGDINKRYLFFVCESGGKGGSIVKLWLGLPPWLAGDTFLNKSSQGLFLMCDHAEIFLSPFVGPYKYCMLMVLSKPSYSSRTPSPNAVTLEINDLMLI